MAQPMVFHRSPVFVEVLNEVNEGLKWVFRSKGPVVTLVGSGTAGMEAAVTNSFSKGDKVVCLRGGRFGDRWSELCATFGLQSIDIEVEWGTAIDPAQVETALKTHPDA